MISKRRYAAVSRLLHFFTSPADAALFFISFRLQPPKLERYYKSLRRKCVNNFGGKPAHKAVVARWWPGSGRRR